MTKHPYASAIGSIMYAMLSTRPDVALALSLTSRFQSNPGMAHWIAVKSILKYLNKTKEMFLVYGGCDEELGVTGYIDASFCSDPDDSKSQTGYVFKVNGGAVCWRSGKQPIVAQSTMESEYIAACEAVNEVVCGREVCHRTWSVPERARPRDPLLRQYGCHCERQGAKDSLHRQTHSPTLPCDTSVRTRRRCEDLQSAYGSECGRSADEASPA